MKNRKVIVLVAVFTAYYVLTHINVARVLRAIQRSSGSSPAASKPAPAPTITPTTLPKQEEVNNPSVAAFQQLAPLVGIWAGKGVLKEKGMCTIRIDLRASPPSRFTGYSSLSCIAFDIVMKSVTKGASPNEAVFGRLAPTSTILSGEAKNGAIILRTDKNIGTAGDDCTVTEIALTPFAEQLAAEWKENKCQGGQLVMVRATQ